MIDTLYQPSTKPLARLTPLIEMIHPSATYFFFMTLLLAGDIQLTLMSVVPCRLQIAMENLPKLARIILMV